VPPSPPLLLTKPARFPLVQAGERDSQTVELEGEASAEPRGGAPTDGAGSPSPADITGSLPAESTNAGTVVAEGGDPLRSNPKLKRSGYIRDPDDWYVEPSHSVEALIAAHPFHGMVYDPACGKGTIPEAFKARGFQVIASDLRDRGYGVVADFLGEGHPTRVDNIVTNPPYRKAIEFIARARELAKRDVAALVRLDFLASQRRMQLVNEAAAIYVLSKRPNMPPGGQVVRASGGQHDFCWVVWSSARLLPFPIIRAILPPSG
jgi:hypothetical protein